MPPHPNIRAVSILDRYLEHQRIYLFGRGAEEKVFAGSSDLMERNLDWRVEVAFPIYDPVLREDIKTFMRFQLEDDVKARDYDGAAKNMLKSLWARQTPERAKRVTDQIRTGVWQ